MSDRVVHARYTGMEIVRYDRPGKWYFEPTIGGVKRQQVTVDKAARQAVWGEQFGHGEVFLDLYGGSAFDRKVRAVREELSHARLTRGTE